MDGGLAGGDHFRNQVACGVERLGVDVDQGQVVFFAGAHQVGHQATREHGAAGANQDEFFDRGHNFFLF